LAVSVTAKAARQRLEQIEKNGGRVVRVEAEALAALHAMRHLITLATSGDLSRNGDSIEASTVREWLARNLPQAVTRLAAEILAEPTAVEEEYPDGDTLLELVARLKIVSAAEAARQTAWPLEKIKDYARTHPLHLGWFGGSCPVVCQAVAQGAREEQIAEGASHGAR
jgi:hypothetical protein